MHIFIPKNLAFCQPSPVGEGGSRRLTDEVSIAVNFFILSTHRPDSRCHVSATPSNASHCLISPVSATPSNASHCLISPPVSATPSNASHCLIPPVSATPTHALRVCVNSHADPQYTLKTLPPFSHRRMQILPSFAPEVGSDLRIMRKYGEKSGKLVNFFQNN